MENCLSTIGFIPTEINETLQEVEALMSRQADGYHPDLQSAIQHLISAGGKRVRPTLTLLIGNMLGGPHDRLVTLAAAIEMLHTATLVHDDLIDGSLLRRGNPTLNAQWSPGATVLTGDFMFARAAKLASDTESIPVISLFSTTLGIIVNGEINQLFSARCSISRPAYFARIYAKTASLFETSAKSAALISNADAEITSAMRHFGHEIGMAFQIMDDILDFIADPAVLGKPVGSDLSQGLVTLPVICYVESNPDTEISDALNKGKCISQQQIDWLIPELKKSGAIHQAYEEACQFVRSGLESLQIAPACPERIALQELAEYFVDRVL